MIKLKVLNVYKISSFIRIIQNYNVLSYIQIYEQPGSFGVQRKRDRFHTHTEPRFRLNHSRFVISSGGLRI